MIRRLSAAACLGRSRLPLMAILAAVCAVNGSPGVGAPVPPQAAAPTGLIQMAHVSVQVMGAGSPVILIPGLSSPRAVWDGVAPALARKHRVYLVQLNGFGGDDPRANLQPGILAGAVAELHQLIATQSLKGVAVVGHSLGGTIGMMLAREHPQDIGRLLVVDALPWVGTAFAPGFTAATAEPMAARMREQMVALYGAMPAAMAQAVGYRNALKPESQAKVAAWSMAADMRVSGHAMYEDLLVDLGPDLARITVPMTVLVPWSAQRGGDPEVAVYRRAFAAVPGVRFELLADSGHFAMLDQPEGFARILTGFLN